MDVTRTETWADLFNKICAPTVAFICSKQVGGTLPNEICVPPEEIENHPESAILKEGLELLEYGYWIKRDQAAGIIYPQECLLKNIAQRAQRT